jgi:hypothetical protein
LSVLEDYVVLYIHFRRTVQLVPSSDPVQVTEAADTFKTYVASKLHGYTTQMTIFSVGIVSDYI